MQLISKEAQLRQALAPADNIDINSKTGFAALFEQTHQQVFRYIYGLYGGSVQDVEDLTAETYAKAWRARDRFEGNTPAALGWLLTIARNSAKDSWRRQKRHGEPHTTIDLLPLQETKPGPEQQSLTNEQAHQLWRLLDRMPQAQREMLVMRYMLGLPVKQIAAHLGKSPNAVTKALQRSLARLRDQWMD